MTWSTEKKIIKVPRRTGLGKLQASAPEDALIKESEDQPEYDG